MRCVLQRSKFIHPEIEKPDSRFQAEQCLERLGSPRYGTELARRLPRNQTSAEELLRDCLRNRRLAGAKFRRQHPIGRYIANFYCHESRLLVELQGSVHNREDQIEYDEIRQIVIEQQGLKVLSFAN